jgi:hypothetical protein
VLRSCPGPGQHLRVSALQCLQTYKHVVIYTATDGFAGCGFCTCFDSCSDSCRKRDSAC